MYIPNDRKYLKTHQWVKEKDGRAMVGITDYAQASLRAIVFVNLPEEGDTVTAGEPFGEIESAKVVSEVISPVSGTVCGVNEDLMDDPSLANTAPYDAWFIEVEDIGSYGELLTAEEYHAIVEAMEA